MFKSHPQIAIGHNQVVSLSPSYFVKVSVTSILEQNKYHEQHYGV